MVWKTLAKIYNIDYEQMPVVMEKVKFRHATIMSNKINVKFIVNIFKETGNFEVCENGSVKVTGKIRVSEKIDKEQTKLPIPVVLQKYELQKNDIYKDLNLKGYEYEGDFKGIIRSDNQFTIGDVEWNDNWVTFIDTMMQFQIEDSTQFLLANKIEKLSINPKCHKEIVKNISKDKAIRIYRYPKMNIIKAGGVELKQFTTTLTPKSETIQSKPKLEKYIFVPYENTKPLDTDPKKAKYHALEVLLQIINENLDVSKFKAAEIIENLADDTLLSPIIMDVILNEPMLTVSDNFI